MTFDRLIDFGRRRFQNHGHSYLFAALSGAGSIVMLSVGGNPDYVLPFIPELLLLCFLLTAAALFAKGRLALSRTEKGLFISCVVLLAYTGVRAVHSIEHTPGQKWIPCFAPDGWFLRSQCFLQAAVHQHYGIRTFALLVCAALAGLLVFVIVRTADDGERRFFLRGLFAGPMIVLIVGWISLLTGMRHWLPDEFPGNVWGRARFTQLILNPSWFWPYILPGLAFALGPVVGSSGRIQVRHLILPAFIGLAILFTQQRGGWAALALIVIAAFLIRNLRGGKLRFRRITALALGVAALTALAIGLLMRFWPLVVQSALRFGIHLRPEMMSMEGGRTVIWTKALGAIGSSPLTGRGYASWFAVMSDSAKSAEAPFVLDTAHNFFLQAVVEHGIPAAILIVLFLAAVVRAAWQSTKDRPVFRSTTILLFIGTLSAMLVQEIDYIRPTICLYAAVWAALAGLPPKSAALPLPAGSGFPGRRGTAVLFAGSAVFCGLGALLLILSLPRNLYPFEGKLDIPGNLRRWAGPSAVLTSMNQESAYENFKVEFTIPGTLTVHGTTTDPGAGQIPWVPARSGRWPARTSVSFSRRFFSEGRTLSAWILFPPVRSNLGAYMTENFEWVSGNLECRRGNCGAVVETCGDESRVRIRISPVKKSRGRYIVAPVGNRKDGKARSGFVDRPILLDVPFSPAEIRVESAGGIVVAAGCGNSNPSL